MKLLRFVSVLALMALMVPLGSTTATTTNSPTVPGNLTDTPALNLRAVGSQLVADTIEDALRQGGLALFDEGFQFESSLNWIFGESIEGEVDAVVPLWSADGYALFAQPGVVFWTGLAEEERIDGNFGAVYRMELADGVIGGGSVFYDYDFQYGHSRIGAGVDLQSGIFQGGFNYYHPLDEWDEGRTDYEEQALRGVDFRIALEREVMRLGANLSYWRFEGEEDEKGDWKPSYGFDAGIRILPGIFLEGGWERHDETVSLDQRWNAGLAFRFSLPDFKGASYGEGGLSSNLWKFVEREKRILYEERLGIPRVSFADTVYENDEDGRVGGVAEGNTVTIPADIGKPLDEDVMLHIMVAETSTATLGTDFTYAHRVYELNETTGEQSAPEGDDAVMACPEALCQVMIPAGVTRFDIEADILVDTDTQEVPESIDFQVEVPEEYAGLVRGSFVEQVTLRGHGNEVQFALAESTLNEDPDAPMGSVEVSVGVDLPSPVSITLNVGATDDAATAMIDRDYRISTRSLTIPANASSASLTLMGINNDVGEGSKTIELTLSGDLPDGWAFGSRTTHTVTLQDDDLAIFFDNAPGMLPETESDDMHTITVSITQAPMTDLVVRVAAGGTEAGTTADPGNDFGLSPVDLTFNAGNLSRTFDISILEDNVAEQDEFIVLTLADMGTQMAREDEGFSLGGNHRITIPANDNTVGFVSGTDATLGEDGGTATVEVSIDNPAPRNITLNITATDDPATVMIDRDYRISTRSLTIPAGERSGRITLTGINNNDSDGNKDITLTLSVVGNLPDGWAEGDLEHVVTLQDDDLSVGFVSSGSEVQEPDNGSITVPVPIEVSQSPPSHINLTITATSPDGATLGGLGSGDYAAPTAATFNMGVAAGTRSGGIITVHSDSDIEEAETVILTISGSLPSGWSFGRETYTLTILPNDNVVSIASKSASTVREGGMANIFVSVDKPSPTAITLNVSATSSSTPAAVQNTDYSFPATLTIPANGNEGMLQVTGLDLDTDIKSGLTIDFTLSGNLPDGWGFVDSSNMAASNLTHSVTITDNDIASIGWTQTEIDIPHPGSGSATHMLTVNVDKFPANDDSLPVQRAGTASEGGDYLLAGVTNSCNVISLTGGAPAGSITCNILLLAAGIAVNDTIILTIKPRAGQATSLANEGIAIGPDTITITIVDP